jgi:hypothetical protein
MLALLRLRILLRTHADNTATKPPTDADNTEDNLGSKLSVIYNDSGTLTLSSAKVAINSAGGLAVYSGGDIRFYRYASTSTLDGIIENDSSSIGSGTSRIRITAGSSGTDYVNIPYLASNYIKTGGSSTASIGTSIVPFNIGYFRTIDIRNEDSPPNYSDGQITTDDYSGDTWMDFTIESNLSFSISETGDVWIDEDLDMPGGTINKGSSNFLIDHPLDPYNKMLRYGMVEAPRYELIHRGTTKLFNGLSEVNIDEFYGLTPGTFQSLCQNVEVVSVQAKNSYERVMASAVDNATFQIVSESNDFNGEVIWVVIGERKDAFIKASKYTDTDGHLINEADKPEPDLSILGDEEQETQDTEKENTQEQVPVNMKGAKGYYFKPEAYGATHPTKKVRYIKSKSNDGQKKQQQIERN